MKKNHFKNTILLVSLLILSSCNWNNKTIQLDEPFVIQLLKEFPLPSTVVKSEQFSNIKVGRIRSIGLADSIAIIIDENVRPRIRYYDLIREIEIGTFLPDKDSSSFISNPIYFNQYSYINNRLCYNLIDAQNNFIIVVDLFKSMTDPNYKWEKKIFLPYNLVLRYKNIFLTKDSSLTGSYIGKKLERENVGGKIFLYNKKTNQLSFSRYSPNVRFERHMKSQEYPYYYYNFSCYNQDRKILVSFNRLFHQVDFVNFQTGQTFSVIDPKKVSPPLIDSAVPIKNSTPEYYYASFSGTKFAYGLCLNDVHQKFLDDQHGTELHLYDWEGQLKRKILLDKSRLMSFVVMEKQGQLFASHYSEKNGYSIVKYNIGLN